MRRRIAFSYREFLLYASLFLLLSALFAAAVRCVFIFPPYMQSAGIAADKAGALDFIAPAVAASAVCVALTCGRDRRFGLKRTSAIILFALTVPAGALALRLGDVYNAQNYVPPAVFFAAFAAAAVTVRSLIIRDHTLKQRKGCAAALICALPLSVISVAVAAVVLSGHKLFATLVFLYIPIPFCASAALAFVAARHGCSAAAMMCVPLSACVFCAIRPFGFGSAYNIAAALSLLLPVAAILFAASDIRLYKNIFSGDKNMANKAIFGLGFHHIALKAINYEESCNFYIEGLGMKPVTKWGEGDSRIQMLDIGDGTILELFAGGSGEPDGGRYIHLAFKCDDVDAAYQTALKAGAKVKSEPRIVALDSKPKPMTLNCAFVYGPSGEEIEFFKILE